MLLKSSLWFAPVVCLAFAACGDGSQQQDVGSDFSNDGSAATDGGNPPGVDGASGDDGGLGTTGGGGVEDGGGADGDADTTTTGPGGADAGTGDGTTTTDSSDGSGDTGGSTTTDSDGGDAGTTDEATGTDGTVVVTPKTMVVYANGTKIGYLNYSYQYAVSVIDPERNILFTVNDSTGFVVGGFVYAYSDSSCDAPGNTISLAEADCHGSFPSTRLAVSGVGGDCYGATQARSLLIETRTLNWGPAYGFNSQGSCVERNFGNECMAAYVPTTIIPTAFPLPIEIRDE